MSILDPKRRRAAATLARSGVVVSAIFFTLSVVTAVAGDVRPAAAAPVAGVAQVITPFEVGEGGSGQPLTSGDSDTEFSLALPPGAACSGDTAGADFRVYSYMVASTVDPATLTFTSEGPAPAALGAPQSAFRQPLHDTTRSPVINLLTSAADQPGGPGRVVNVPAMSFVAFDPANTGETFLPAGDYNIGIACWGPGSSPGLDAFWNAEMTIVADSGDSGPVGIKWTAESSAAATTVALTAAPANGAEEGDEITLTATLTPAAATGLVEFKNGTTTLGSPVTVQNGKATLKTDDLEAGQHSLTASYTPAQGASFAPSTSPALSYTVSEPGATTTTRAGSSTTSTTSSGSSTTSTSSAVLGSGSSSGAGPSTGVGFSGLARTGASVSAVVWGVLLVLFGRMAILLGRPPRVIPLDAP